MNAKKLQVTIAGNHIAWVFRTPLGEVWQRNYVYEVWLSDSDGSNLKRLSGFPPCHEEPMLPGQQRTIVSMAFPVRWTVDDTAISYLQGDRLQLVKVKEN